MADFVQRVRKRFGSYARGDYRAESDVDGLVLVEDLARSERRGVFDLAEAVYFDHQVRISPLVQSTAEYATIARREYLIAADIARDQVPL